MICMYVCYMLFNKYSKYSKVLQPCFLQPLTAADDDDFLDFSHDDIIFINIFFL